MLIRITLGLTAGLAMLALAGGRSLFLMTAGGLVLAVCLWSQAMYFAAITARRTAA